MLFLLCVEFLFDLSLIVLYFLPCGIVIKKFIICHLSVNNRMITCGQDANLQFQPFDRLACQLNPITLSIFAMQLFVTDSCPTSSDTSKHQFQLESFFSCLFSTFLRGGEQSQSRDRYEKFEPIRLYTDREAYCSCLMLFFDPVQQEKVAIPIQLRNKDIRRVHNNSFLIISNLVKQNQQIINQTIIHKNITLHIYINHRQNFFQNFLTVWNANLRLVIYLEEHYITLMGWIFDTCTDKIGSCIRQYIMFGLSLIAFILAAYSCFSIRRKQNKLPFELLPLSINAITSLVIFIAYTQLQIFNIRILLLIVQLYSYFILTYGFVFMALKTKSDFVSKFSKRLQRIFISVSIAFLISIIVTIILTSVDVIDCNQDQQGAGPIFLMALQIPLFIIAIIFSRRSKALIRKGSKIDQIDRTQYTHKTYLLITQQDQQKRIKINQINLVLYSFLVSFILHAIEIYCYQVQDPQFICSQQTNQIQINSQLQLYIFWIENLSQLFPLFAIPIIFWYLPAKMSAASTSIFMTNGQLNEQFQSRDQINRSGKVKMSRQKSSLDVKSEQQIRFKLNQNRSPQPKQRHPQRILTL